MRGSFPLVSIFTPSKLIIELEWLNIRDLFLGQNEVQQDVPRALLLAASCEHADALWLTKILDGKSVKTKEGARDIFCSLGDDDARGLCFAELIMTPHVVRWNMQRVRRSAELGYAFGQAMVYTNGEELFKLANASTIQRERDGFRKLAGCFHFGIGCKRDLLKARENYVISVELGRVSETYALASFHEDTDPLHWFWLGRGAPKFWPGKFLNEFGKQVECFKSGSGSAAVVFSIGRALSGQVNEKKHEIFSHWMYDFDATVRPANDAIAFYNAQLAACRKAVDAWCLFAIRFGVVKDIRILIGKMIWEARDLALYKVWELFWSSTRRSKFKAHYYSH